MDLEHDKELNLLMSQSEEEKAAHSPLRWPRYNPNQRPKGQLKSSSTGYFKIINDPLLNKRVKEYAALSIEEQRVYNLILDKKIRKNTRKKNSETFKINLAFALQSNNIKAFEFQAYLEGVTKQLELEGLWREALVEKCESELFSMADLKDDDLDGNLEPKELQVIYNPKNKTPHKDPFREFQEEGLEWIDHSFCIDDLPQFTTPTVYNLLRRSPWTIFESIARKMIEGSFFMENPELEKLFPCAYFFSKSILERKLFIKVKYEAFRATPLQKIFRTYSYRQYQQDQKLLLKVIKKLLKKYFQFHPILNQKIETSQLSSLWSRFLVTYSTLTKKQLEALELKYTTDPVLTYVEAAIKLGISKDSFQDRVRGAIKKIRKALPELDYIEYEDQSSNDYVAKNNKVDKILPLYQVDLKSGAKTEIPVRTGNPKPRKEAPSKDAVRAWSICATPIPDIIFTDFNLGLVPEAHIARKSGQSKFRW